MSARAKRLKHSANDKGGVPLETGRMWKIHREHSLNVQFVYASPEAIRLVTIWNGEWEQAQREAVHFSPEEARAVGEALLDAAEASLQHRNWWTINETRVPRPQFLAAHSSIPPEWIKEAEEDANAAEQERPSDLVGVLLEDAGDRKIGVIKTLREHVPGLDLREAKRFVDDNPRVVMDGVTRDAAERAVACLTAAGATAVIVERLTALRQLLDQ